MNNFSEEFEYEDFSYDEIEEFNQKYSDRFDALCDDSDDYYGSDDYFLDKREEQFDVLTKLGFDEDNEYFCDHQSNLYWVNLLFSDDSKAFRTAKSIYSDYQIITSKWKYQHLFKNYIAEELIAAALHPCRIQAQMDQYEDMEQFFENI